MSAASGTPVHCDPSILHAPGECEYCDKYGAEWQEYRELARINFTGHADADKAPCPSTHFRPTEVAHRWPGNQPQTITPVVTTSAPVWVNPDGTTTPVQSTTATAGPLPTDCPHADPHRYCDGCKVTPCPIGLDQ